MSANECRRLFFLPFFLLWTLPEHSKNACRWNNLIFFSYSSSSSDARKKRAGKFKDRRGHWGRVDSKLLPASQEGVDWLADPSATSGGREKGKNTNMKKKKKLVACRSKCSEAQKRQRAASQWTNHRATGEIRNIKPGRNQINKKGIGAAALCVSFSVNIFY